MPPSMGAYKRRKTRFRAEEMPLPSENPLLLLIAGQAGAGKTTLARELARRKGWTLCEKDALTRPLVERLLIALGSPLGAEDRDTPLYLEEARPLEYQCLFDAAFLNLDLGNSVVVDAPLGREFNDPLWRRDLETRCSQVASGPALCYYVWTQVSEATRRQRLIQRNAARDRRKLETWDSDHAVLPAPPAPLMPCLVVENADGAFDPCLDAILRYTGRDDMTGLLPPE